LNKGLFKLSLLFCTLSATGAFAFSGGIAGRSQTGCGGCHSGGSRPTVNLSGPSTLTAGSSSVYSLTISGGAGSCGGLDVSVSGGSLSITGSDGPSEYILSGEVTQSSRGSYSGSSLVYTFTAKAGTGSSMTLHAAGLSGCGTGSSLAGLTSMTVTIGSNTPPPTVATPASASPSTVTGTTTQVSVLGASSAGESTLTYHWSSSPTGVTFSPNGTNAAKTATATFPSTGTYTLTAKIQDAAAQSVTSSTTVVVNSSTGKPPTITQPATATQTPVTGTTVGLSVGAQDPAGGTLSYAWSATGPANVSFSPAHAATTQATFTAPGTYGVTVVITGGGGSTTSQTSVTVNATATTVALSPLSPTIPSGTSLAFQASVTDQFGAAMSSGTSIHWSATGDGTIDASGNFTAGAQAGTAVVTASSGSMMATTPVTISQSPNPVVTNGSLSIQWLSPAAGSTVSSVVLLRAAANDPSGVRSVSFSVDGQALDTVGGPDFEMNWDSTTVANGKHVLAAVATNTGGTTVTASLGVTVGMGGAGAQGGCGGNVGSGPPILWLALVALAFLTHRAIKRRAL
jgi:hypothetical protein